MEIKKNTGPSSEWEKMKSGQIESASVVLGINKKRVKIEKGQIKKIAHGLAEIAYSMGETNDQEEFADEMAQDILEALQETESSKKAKRKKKK